MSIIKDSRLSPLFDTPLYQQVYANLCSGPQLYGSSTMTLPLFCSSIVITLGLPKSPSRSAQLNRKCDRIVVEIPVFRKGELW